MEIYFDDNLELSPASLDHFVRWLGQGPVGIVVAVVELEVDLLDIGGHVLILVWLDIDCPLMGVAVLLSLLSKVFTHISINYWLDHSHSLLSGFNIS